MTTIKDFPNYTIDEYGTVTNKHSRIMKQLLNSNTYFRVNLRKNGESYAKSVHRLLGEAFIPNPDNKPCIDHIDRNKQNNSLDNLRWVTHQENMQNLSIRWDNTSGEMNIVFNKRDNCYQFEKSINHKKYSKSFDTLEEAIIYRDNFIPEDHKLVEKSRNNKSGHMNICFHKRDNNWQFAKLIKGKKIYKTFKTLEEAVEFKESLTY